MGFYRNSFMENSKKMMYCFLFLPFFISCKQEIKNKEYITIKESILYFKHFTFSNIIKQEGSYKKDDSIFFSKVFFENKNISNNKIIDPETFDVLYNDINDRKKVSNDYYLRGDDYYFKDKNYLYIYQDDISDKNKFPLFFVAGKVNEYSVIGGGYLRVGNKIYCKGNELVDVDINTFKIAMMRLKHSEWFQTIGFDKNSIYMECKKENKEKLDQYKKDIIGINLDSLQKRYSE